MTKKKHPRKKSELRIVNRTASVCPQCGGRLPPGAQLCAVCNPPLQQEAVPPAQESIPPVQISVPPAKEDVPPIQENVSVQEDVSLPESVSELSENSPPDQTPSSGQAQSAEVKWIDSVFELEAKEDWPGMIAWCRRWIEAEPARAAAWYNLGVACGRSGEAGQAIEYFRKALDIDAGHKKAWYNLGVAYSQSGEVRQAIECYRKVLDLDPRQARAWYNLGAAHGRSGRNEEVHEAYRELISLDPQLAEKLYRNFKGILESHPRS